MVLSTVIDIRSITNFLSEVLFKLQGLSRYCAAQLVPPRHPSTKECLDNRRSLVLLVLSGALIARGRAGDEFILSGQVELLALPSGGNANASGKHGHEPARLWGHAKNCR